MIKRGEERERERGGEKAREGEIGERERERGEGSV